VFIAHRRHAPAVQLAVTLHQRRHRVAASGRRALQGVQPLDVVVRGAALEDRLLDRVELALERIEHREVAVDHRVHQRVQHEAGALSQLLGLALAALAHAQKAVRAAVAHRQHEVGAGEDRDLARHQLAGLDLRQLHHDEQREPYSSIFGPLVAVAGVLDRQLVQLELLAASAAARRRWRRAAPPRRSSPGVAAIGRCRRSAMSASLRPSS
jgi:hypothetical protein